LTKPQQSNASCFILNTPDAILRSFPQRFFNGLRDGTNRSKYRFKITPKLKKNKFVLYYHDHRAEGIPVLSAQPCFRPFGYQYCRGILSFLTCNLETLFETIFKHNFFITASTNI